MSFAKNLANILVFLGGFFLSLQLIAVPLEPVKIGLDAEFGHKTSTADDAILLGMEIAIDEINRSGGVLGGRPLELITRDNRGVPARGQENLRQLAETPNLVAVFGSKFSPVVLAQRDLAHALKVPMLLPWSAADAIVDHPANPSYVFRLSLRDSWAIPFMMNEARQRGFQKVGMLIPNGAWGRSNQKVAEAYATTQRLPTIVKMVVYEWTDDSLANEFQELVAAGAEVVLIVGNEPEVSLLVRDMTALPRANWRPLLSHWGASAGDLPAMSGGAFFDVDLQVVQTFSFFGPQRAKMGPVLEAALKRRQISDPARLLSVVGLAHAYDLTHILALAINKAGSIDRELIRDALEMVGPYDGLVRHYDQPFARERHEALSPQQLFMGRWRRDGAIVRVGR